VREETTNRYFDELASGLASGSISRRKALRLMGAALVGGTLGSLGGVAAADDCKRNGKACKKNSQCCSGNCVNGTCSACPAGSVELSNGTCAKPCTTPYTNCAGERCYCVPSDTGGSYCGTPGIVLPSGPCSSFSNPCPSGQFCQDVTGGCFIPC
jgi:hypothetical protein